MCKPSPVLTIFSQPVPKTGPGSEEFGTDQHPKDLLQNGVLQMAPSGQAACGAFRNLLVLSRVTTVYWEEPWHAEGLMNTAVSRSGGGLMFWVVKIRALNFGWNVESIVLKKRWALKDPKAATPPALGQFEHVTFGGCWECLCAYAFYALWKPNPKTYVGDTAKVYP